MKRKSVAILTRIVMCASLLYPAFVPGTSSAVTAAPTVTGPSYKASVGFSNLQGLNSWKYQYVTSGGTDYHDYDLSASSRWWNHTSGNWSFGSVAAANIHPGSGIDGVRTFVAPFTGTISINAAGNISSLSTSNDGVQIKLLQNNVQLWPASGWYAVAPGQNVPFNEIQTSVVQGDQIHFIVNAGANNNGDDTRWDGVVAYSTVVSTQAPQSVTLSQHALQLAIGDSTQLIPAVTPSNAVNASFSWTSSDPNIASVSADGTVTVNAPGSATITVVTSAGNLTDTCAVTGTGLPPFKASQGFSGIQGDHNWRYQYVTTGGTNYTDDAIYAGARWWGDVQNNWLKSSIGAAHIHPGSSVDGVLTFVAPETGDVKITANGGISTAATSADGVRVKIMKNNVQIWPSSGWQTVGPGQNVTLPVQQLSVLQGDLIHFIVNGGANGNINSDDTAWDSAVAYTDVQTTVVPQSIALDQHELQLAVGDTAQLTPQILPADATNKSVSWASSDPSVATVSDTGVVTIVTPGNAAITARTNSGNLTDSCNVVVTTTAADYLAQLITPSDPTSIQRGIDFAYKFGLPGLVIPPGTYPVAYSAGKKGHLNLINMHDFEISAYGVKLIMADPTAIAVYFQNSKNVTFKGATLDFAVLPFTQGAIEAIDPNGKWLDLRIDQGYPTHFDDPKYFLAKPPGSIYDNQTLLIKDGTPDMYPTSVERRGSDLFRINYDSISSNTAVGDLMAFRGTANFNIQVDTSENTSLKDLTIWASNGFAIVESGGEGNNHYDHIQLTPGPEPAGATRDRILSSTADGFHSSRVRVGPTITNSLFEKMTDDGIAIHGAFGMTMEAQGNQVTVATASVNFFQAGDLVRFYDSEMNPIDEAHIQSVTSNISYTGGLSPVKDSFTGTQFHRLVLDRAVDTHYTDFIASPNSNGSGFTIMNNTIRNNRARGMLIKADDGVIQGNTFENNSLRGLMVEPELIWNESGYSHNLLIKDNIFRNTGRQDAALSIYGPAMGHADITLDHNTFENNAAVNAQLSGIHNLTIKDNVFGNTQDLTKSQLVLDNSDGVAFSNNQFAAGQKDVSYTFSVSNVTGIVLDPLPYQASLGYSGTQGLYQWRYQSVAADGTDYTDIPVYDGVWWNVKSNWEKGKVESSAMQPGDTRDSVRTFVAPHDGQIDITSNGPIQSLYDTSRGNGIRVKVMQGTTQLWPAAGWADIAKGASANFPAIQAQVTEGEKIYFIADAIDGNSFDDLITWDPVIRYFD